MKLSDFVQQIKETADLKDHIIYHKYIPEKKAEFSELRLGIELKTALERLGIKKLFSHQAEAISAIRDGKDVVVCTGTCSGKSLIYNISVIEKILKDPKTTALYIFPLKALEQDQLISFNQLGSSVSEHIKAGIYDGDTDPDKRREIKTGEYNVIFTNPDMLHLGILPYHEMWRRFFERLGFVVIDEIHTYRGIFGSHLVQIIKRLRRICNRYGTDPQFILLSATIHNPAEFASRLIQKPVYLVENDGSPSAGKHFLLIDPDISSNFLASQLFVRSIRSGFRTIVFTQSRRITELIHIWSSQLAPELRQKISSYRAGFLSEERREIERKLISGELLGVVSTSALEMGIDIGELDVCILVGYPGTIINTWQRSGRVGRSGRESLVILISGKDALDQYFMRHPEELFERPFESAVIDPDNPHILDAHLVCAAAELPLRKADKKYWGDELENALLRCELKGELVKDIDEDCWLSRRKNPHLLVNIRSTGEGFTIFDKTTGHAIGTIDGVRALKECHPGAIYLHRALQYKIHHIDISKKDIIATETNAQYFTRPIVEKETEIIEVNQTKEINSFVVRKGKLKVTEKVVGYEKRKIHGQELLGVYPLELPPNIFETKGIWIEISGKIKEKIERQRLHFMGGIHAIEHAMIGMLPFFALCDRNDVGGISYTYHPQVGKSAVFIYDGYPGGVGICAHGFNIIEDWLKKTLNLIKECECESGCPSCIHSPKCGSGNKPLDKNASVQILQMLLQPCEKKEEKIIPPRPLNNRRLNRDHQDYRIVVFDLETQKGADEVGGWKNAHLMRVSVAVAYDSFLDRFLVFMESELSELVKLLQKADLVVGFNIKRFDYKVLSAYTDIKTLAQLPTFDILEDIHKRLGFRLSLNHLALNTLNKEKLGNGLMALKWFKEGNMERLITYCKQDVFVTKELFYHGLKKGYLVYRRKNRRFRLLLDWNIEEMTKNESL
jgi:DEAD/DEAH box helicase domain-containing protein